MASAHMKCVIVMMRNIAAEMLSCLDARAATRIPSDQREQSFGIYETTSFAQYSSVMF